MNCDGLSERDVNCDGLSERDVNCDGLSKRDVNCDGLRTDILLLRDAARLAVLAFVNLRCAQSLRRSSDLALLFGRFAADNGRVSRFRV